MPIARQLVASRCPECSAPVDLKQVPVNVDQIRCAYCGTPLLLPKRATHTETSPVYRPPVTPPPFMQTRLQIQGRPMSRGPVIAMPSQPKRKGNAGCGIVVSLLIFGVMLAADVGIFRALESAFGRDVANP
jgi:DNA-directed RNA polymerase subunit RPC12/RpoP